MSEKQLEVKKMIQELETGVMETAPNVFICPISLEPMLDPVTLCTGQTYERSNITKWISMGHMTCPTTMQELWDPTLTPNKTLQTLIFSWVQQKYVVMKKRSEDVGGRVLEALESLKRAKGKDRVCCLKVIRDLVGSHLTSRENFVIKGGVGVVVGLLGPLTSHTVGSEVVGILVQLSLDDEANVGLVQPARVSVIVDLLNEGSLETKVNCTKLIHRLMEIKGFEPELVSSLRLLVGLLRLVRDKRGSAGREPNGVRHGLLLLKRMSLHECLRHSMISVGGVGQLVELLPVLNAECLELALGVLDNLAGVEEGRLRLKEFSSTIPNLVKLLMRVSENCTQLALSILFAVCKLAPEECAPVAVEAGLAAKLLLVIQSGCNPTLKQQSAELLKLCSLNYTATIFMSKCKLTRTLQ